MSSDSLEKAKSAIADAAGMDVDINEKHVPIRFSRLLDIASVQACIAHAEAAEQMVEILTGVAKTLRGRSL